MRKRAPSSRIFVDSSAFFAFTVRTDDHHEEAVAVLERITRQALQLVTTTYIVAEAHALFLRRVGRDAAATFLRIFDESSVLLLRPGRDDEQEARAIIYRYTDKQFSLTDAISFAVMNRLRITTAFSFDDDFRQFGFTLATG